MCTPEERAHKCEEGFRHAEANGNRIRALGKHVPIIAACLRMEGTEATWEQILEACVIGLGEQHMQLIKGLMEAKEREAHPLIIHMLG